jgi:hypothetical protein
MFELVFTVAQIFVDQIVNQWNTLDHLGLSDNSKRFLCDGNQVVVMNSLISHSSLQRTHKAINFHHIRELIASKVLGYHLVNAKFNLADKVSKRWTT